MGMRRVCEELLKERENKIGTLVPLLMQRLTERVNYYEGNTHLRSLVEFKRASWNVDMLPHMIVIALSSLNLLLIKSV